MMPAFLDSHAHLADPAFDADRGDVVARALADGALGIICIGESVAAARRARLLAAGHVGRVWFTAGVHPHDAREFNPDRDLPALRELVAGGAVAIGECGLDYHYAHSPRDRQLAAFEAQLELARELARPVVVHTREAEDDTSALVDVAQRAGVVGVLHCYTGSLQLARRAVDAGWFVSFSGIITFKRWDGDALVRSIPVDRLLAESDAPYLAPVPYRGRRNEPAWVWRTVQRLAEIRGEPPELVAAATAANAVRLFGLQPTPVSPGHPAA